MRCHQARGGGWARGAAALCYQDTEDFAKLIFLKNLVFFLKIEILLVRNLKNVGIWIFTYFNFFLGSVSFIMSIPDSVSVHLFTTKFRNTRVSVNKSEVSGCLPEGLLCREPRIFVVRC